MNSNRLDTLVRREITARLPKLLDGRGTDQFLPDYQVVLPTGFRGKQLRYLSPLNYKKHGKRRIYSDTSYTGQKASDIYIAYITKRDLLTLYPMLKTSELLEALGDKWIMTVGRSATSRHAKLSDFLNSVVVYEKKRSKSNHPPLGDTEEMWSFGPCIEKILSCPNGIPWKIICSINVYP